MRYFGRYGVPIGDLKSSAGTAGGRPYAAVVFHPNRWGESSRRCSGAAQARSFIAKRANSRSALVMLAYNTTAPARSGDFKQVWNSVFLRASRSSKEVREPFRCIARRSVRQRHVWHWGFLDGVQGSTMSLITAPFISAWHVGALRKPCPVRLLCRVFASAALRRCAVLFSGNKPCVTVRTRRRRRRSAINAN